MVLLLRGCHGIKLSWRGLVPDPPYIKRAFFLGFPGSVELSTRGLGLVVMSFLVASFGTLIHFLPTLATSGPGCLVMVNVAAHEARFVKTTCWGSLLLAQRRRAQTRDECPLLGARRTVPIYEYTA